MVSSPGIVQMYSKVIDSISDILVDYDYYIIDLWGVVHDGIKLYPEALLALQKIKHSGGKIIFLSNAPRRKHKVASRLSGFGIDEKLYHDIVSSGELLFHNINEHIPAGSKRYFYIGYEKDMDILERTEFIKTNDIASADFILCADLEDGLVDRMSEGLKHDLSRAAELNIPFLCANPDIYIVLQSGGTQYCAGYIGQYYEELGGKVIYFGKPYIDGYEACKKSFAISGFERVIAIVDNFHTDISGAANCGIDSLLVRCGVHRDVLATAHGLEELIREYKVCPSYNIESFR